MTIPNYDTNNFRNAKNTDKQRNTIPTVTHIDHADSIRIALHTTKLLGLVNNSTNHITRLITNIAIIITVYF